MDINGKKIVLTGAASGIGRALLTQLASFDADILAVDLNGDKQQQVVTDLKTTMPKARLHSFGCDVSVQENIDLLFEHAQDTLGGIDLFFANAGFAYYEKIERPDWQRMEKIFRVNVFQPIYVAEKMRQLNPIRDYKVVITASAIAKVGLPGFALYSSTKAAIDRFAESYRLELEPNGTIMCVYPIGVTTPFYETAGEGTPVPWPNQTAEEVATAVIVGIEQERHSVYPSMIFRVGLALRGALPFLITPIMRFNAWQNYRQWLQARKGRV